MLNSTCFSKLIIISLLAIYGSLLIHAETFTIAAYDSIFHDNIYRTFLLRLPPGYDGMKRLPVIIALHGGLGNSYTMENASMLTDSAGKYGYIVVYPEGIPLQLLPNSRTWNAGYCCGNASEQNIDDVGFISELIDTLANRLSIDTARIYATGISNGGMMSYRLACELSGKIAAIAPVAANLVIYSDCQPVRAVPVIHFHSKLDENVPYSGGINVKGLDVRWNPPVDSVLGIFTGRNNCNSLPDTAYSGSDFTFIKWTGCDCGYEVQLYLTEDGGHSWPGGNKGSAVGDPPSEAINANEKMLEFFGRFSLDCSYGSSNEINYESNYISFEIVRSSMDAEPNIFLSLPEERRVSINIYNCLGSLLERLADDYFPPGISRISLNTGKLNPGLYFAVCETNGFVKAVKFLMNE